jgi:tRNA pseudouridine55 synthase
MVLGTETTTLDAAGTVTAVHDMAGVSLADVRVAAAGFVGHIEQIPPMVSAVKIDGKRLHELAREGKEVERAPRPVVVYSLDVAPTEDPATFRLEVRCGSGTYVRTLAADIGTALGGGAHVGMLRRTAVGSFGEDQARPVDHPQLLSMVEGLRDLRRIEVDEVVAVAIAHGKMLDRTLLGLARDDAGPWAMVGPDGTLSAVYETRDETLVKPSVVIPA